MASFEDGGRQCRLPGVPGCRINVVSWRWMVGAIVESTKTYANSLAHRSLFVRLFVLRQVKSKEFAQVVFLLPFRFLFLSSPGRGRRGRTKSTRAAAQSCSETGQPSQL